MLNAVNIGDWHENTKFKGQLVLHAFIYLVLNTCLTASSIV